MPKNSWILKRQRKCRMIVIEIKTLFSKCVQRFKWGSSSTVTGIKNKNYEMIWQETKVKKCLKEYFRILCENESYVKERNEKWCYKCKCARNKNERGVINIVGTLNRKTTCIDGISGERLKQIHLWSTSATCLMYGLYE